MVGKQRRLGPGWGTFSDLKASIDSEGWRSCGFVQCVVARMSDAESMVERNVNLLNDAKA